MGRCNLLTAQGLAGDVTVCRFVTSVELHFGGQCNIYAVISFAFRSLAVERPTPAGLLIFRLAFAIG